MKVVESVQLETHGLCTYSNTIREIKPIFPLISARIAKFCVLPRNVNLPTKKLSINFIHRNAAIWFSFCSYLTENTLNM